MFIPFIRRARIHCPPHSTMSKEDLQVVVDLMSCLFVQLIYTTMHFYGEYFLCSPPQQHTHTDTKGRHFVRSLALEKNVVDEPTKVQVTWKQSFEFCQRFARQ
jgi:hypothetical protein